MAPSKHDGSVSPSLHYLLASSSSSSSSLSLPLNIEDSSPPASATAAAAAALLHTPVHSPLSSHTGFTAPPSLSPLPPSPPVMTPISNPRSPRTFTPSPFLSHSPHLAAAAAAAAALQPPPAHSHRPTPPPLFPLYPYSFADSMSDVELDRLLSFLPDMNRVPAHSTAPHSSYFSSYPYLGLTAAGLLPPLASSLSSSLATSLALTNPLSHSLSHSLSNISNSLSLSLSNSLSHSLSSHSLSSHSLSSHSRRPPALSSPGPAPSPARVSAAPRVSLDAFNEPKDRKDPALLSHANS